jgi:hypothetical protein
MSIAGPRFSSLTAPRRAGHSSAVRRGALFACVLTAASGCGTVDPGDNFVPPDVMIDDEYFFCVVQPDVVTMHRCASGGAGEAGSCHSARSAMLLLPAAEAATRPMCNPDGTLAPGAVVPMEYMINLERVGFTVQSDPDFSPFYRRPLGRDSHPRVIFAEGDAAAGFIRMWILRGGS